RRGVPQRLFTLPVSSLTLVAVPITLGIVFAELTYWALVSLNIVDRSDPGWAALKLGAFMVTYQMILWAAANIGVFRILLLGTIGVYFALLERSSTAITLTAGW